MVVPTLKITPQERDMLSVFMGEPFPDTIDFNWLMHVVEKIEKEGYAVIISKNVCTILDHGRVADGSKIMATYKAVIDYIKHSQLDSKERDS